MENHTQDSAINMNGSGMFDNNVLTFIFIFFQFIFITFLLLINFKKFKNIEHISIFSNNFNFFYCYCN